MYRSPEDMGSMEKVNEATVNGRVAFITEFLKNDHVDATEIEAAINMVKHFREDPNDAFETPDLKNRLDTAINSFDSWVFAHK